MTQEERIIQYTKLFFAIIFSILGIIIAIKL
jgi:hypothetical protein